MQSVCFNIKFIVFILHFNLVVNIQRFTGLTQLILPSFIGLPSKFSTLSLYLLVLKVVKVNFDPCRTKDESAKVSFKMTSVVYSCLRKTVIHDIQIHTNVELESVCSSIFNVVRN